MEAVISPAAILGSAHRKRCKHEVNRLDVTMRRLMRSVVVPPGTDWNAPHETLHTWNVRVQEHTPAHMKPWYLSCALRTPDRMGGLIGTQCLAVGSGRLERRSVAARSYIY